MKKIIALKGKAQVGKSFTIKSVYEILKTKYSNLKVLQEQLGGDIQVIITINNYKIGIESQGDPNSRIYESIPLFIKNKCDIIICATRTRGGTVKLIEDCRNKNYEIKWLRQNVINGNDKQIKSNMEMANDIVDIISETIK